MLNHWPHKIFSILKAEYQIMVRGDHFFLPALWVVKLRKLSKLINKEKPKIMWSGLLVPCVRKIIQKKMLILANFTKCACIAKPSPPTLTWALVSTLVRVGPKT